MVYISVVSEHIIGGSSSTNRKMFGFALSIYFATKWGTTFINIRLFSMQFTSYTFYTHSNNNINNINNEFSQVSKFGLQKEKIHNL